MAEWASWEAREVIGEKRGTLLDGIGSRGMLVCLGGRSGQRKTSLRQSSKERKRKGREAGMAGEVAM